MAGCTRLCRIDGRQFETILSLNKTRDDKKIAQQRSVVRQSGGARTIAVDIPGFLKEPGMFLLRRLKIWETT